MTSGSATMRLADQRIEVGRLDSTLPDLRLDGTVLAVGSERSVAELEGLPWDARLELYRGARSHNPTEVVAEAVELGREVRPNSVLGIGSASAIDLAKAVADQVDAPVIAVPTTLGGAETTRFYGSRYPDGTKGGGGGKRLLPRTVIYDDQLLSSLDGKWLAASGLNALAHAVEAAYARAEHWHGTAAAVTAGHGLPARLLAAASGRSPALHRELFRLACLAGFATNSNGMGLHHAICHVLGGLTGAPHALLNTVVLPHAVATNRELAPDHVRATLETLDLIEIEARVRDIVRAHGLPSSLRELGVTAADLETAAPLVMKAHHLKNNPARISHDDVVACLGRALHADEE